MGLERETLGTLPPRLLSIYTPTDTWYQDVSIRMNRH